MSNFDAANFDERQILMLSVDVSILLLLTNRYNKGILLHFCQQNGKKIAKLKILTKPSGNGLKNILGQKIFFGA